jgi:dihydrofolate reductase
MSEMKISFVVAVADNGIIGKNGSLPWDIPADLKFFKEKTMGHPIVMGRKTFEGIGRVLPGRTNIIVTRNENYKADGAVVVSSLDHAFEVASSEADEVMVIGGAEIYNMAMDVVSLIYITEVHFEPDGDASFIFDKSNWRETHREFFEASGDSPAYSFVTLER